MTASLRFERGTLVVHGAAALRAPHVVWDARTRNHRATAHQYRMLREIDPEVEDDIATRWNACAWREPELRPYQVDALAAWDRQKRRGTIVLPTGAGKTHVALGAAAMVRGPTVVLVPTRVLLSQWVSAISKTYDGRIGVLGDGEQRIEDVTVMTFESAYRHMDVLGDRFELLVVDEVHHFGSGARVEALQACAAPYRLGLTATAPSPGSAGDLALVDLVGPVVFSMAIVDLVGTHLATFEKHKYGMPLDREERARYEAWVRPFEAMRERIVRERPWLSWKEILVTIARMPGGKQAFADWNRGVALAAFCKEKRAQVASLIERHRADKTLVFSMLAEHAYAISRDNLVPALTADISRAERERILEAFRKGSVRCIVSARVLNEGVDVPDASVAILVGGALGIREQIQRIGRVLRPAPGKRALVYDVFTHDTIDERRSSRKWRKFDPERKSPRSS